MKRYSFTFFAATLILIQAPRSVRACETCGKGKTATQAAPMPSEYEAVLKHLNKTGDYKANVLRVSIPPSKSLLPSVDGTALPIPFGFGGWLAMSKGSRSQHVMMGDLVLLEDEVNPVMSAVLQNGLEVTALHNHFFWETPRVFYMHVHGVGRPEELAQKVKPAVDLIGTIPARHSFAVDPQRRVEAGKVDTAALDRIIGHSGESLGGGAVYKYTIGRDDLTVKEHGATINARMGLNTWASFFGTDQNAVVAGDVAMLENELQSVLKALRDNRLEVVAIHHHMTESRPVFIFLHYWGRGPADSLARGFRAALDMIGKGNRRSKTGH